MEESKRRVFFLVWSFRPNLPVFLCHHPLWGLIPIHRFLAPDPTTSGFGPYLDTRPMTAKQCLLKMNSRLSFLPWHLTKTIPLSMCSATSAIAPAALHLAAPVLGSISICEIVVPVGMAPKGCASPFLSVSENKEFENWTLAKAHKFFKTQFDFFQTTYQVCYLYWYDFLAFKNQWKTKSSEILGIKTQKENSNILEGNQKISRKTLTILKQKISREQNWQISENIGMADRPISKLRMAQVSATRQAKIMHYVHCFWKIAAFRTENLIKCFWW